MKYDLQDRVEMVHPRDVPAALTKPRDVFAKALKLPERERAALAAELLASLRPGSVPHEESADFRAEVEKRANRVQSGESAGLDWEETLEELSAV